MDIKEFCEVMSSIVIIGVIIIFKISLYMYIVMFLCVNFYYLRDDVKLIYNPKTLYKCLQNIVRSVL